MEVKSSPPFNLEAAKETLEKFWEREDVKTPILVEKIGCLLIH